MTYIIYIYIIYIYIYICIYIYIVTSIQFTRGGSLISGTVTPFRSLLIIYLFIIYIVTYLFVFLIVVWSNINFMLFLSGNWEEKVSGRGGTLRLVQETLQVGGGIQTAFPSLSPT